MPIPAVSVVIPSYNRAHYLREAVESVLGQTFGDFEIVIVDDGSQDNTPEIGQDYADRYNNVSFISQENAGVGAARNTGVNNACGELIAFLDDDDIFHPDRLERQVTLMRERDDIDACLTNFAPIGEKKGTARRRKSKWMWQGTGLMIRRITYKKLGGYREYFRLAEDMDFFLLFDEHHRYEFIDEVLYFYRKYSLGSSDNLSNTSPLSVLPYSVATLFSAHCRRSGMPDPIAVGETVENIFPHVVDLPAEIRLRLLHGVRNSGRRLLASGKGDIDNMDRIEEYLRIIGGKDCQPQVRKYRLWLALQSLRYGKLKSAWLFAQKD